MKLVSLREPACGSKCAHKTGEIWQKTREGPTWHVPAVEYQTCRCGANDIVAVRNGWQASSAHAACLSCQHANCPSLSAKQTLDHHLTRDSDAMRLMSPQLRGRAACLYLMVGSHLAAAPSAIPRTHLSPRPTQDPNPIPVLAGRAACRGSRRGSGDAVRHRRSHGWHHAPGRGPTRIHQLRASAPHARR